MSTVKGGPSKVISNCFNTALACVFSCNVLSCHASPSQAHFPIFPNLQQRWNADIAKIHKLNEDPLVLRQDNAPVDFLLSCWQEKIDRSLGPLHWLYLSWLCRLQTSLSISLVLQSWWMVLFLCTHCSFGQLFKATVLFCIRQFFVPLAHVQSQVWCSLFWVFTHT